MQVKGHKSVDGHYFRSPLLLLSLTEIVYRYTNGNQTEEIHAHTVSMGGKSLETIIWLRLDAEFYDADSQVHCDIENLCTQPFKSHMIGSNFLKIDGNTKNRMKDLEKVSNSMHINYQQSSIRFFVSLVRLCNVDQTSIGQVLIVIAIKLSTVFYIFIIKIACAPRKYDLKRSFCLSQLLWPHRNEFNERVK